MYIASYDNTVFSIFSILANLSFFLSQFASYYSIVPLTIIIDKFCVNRKKDNSIIYSNSKNLIFSLTKETIA